MNRRYRLTSGLDTVITIEIDDEKIPIEMAREINGFWSSADEVLDASGGDVFQAVARRAAGQLLGFLIDGYNEAGAVSELLDSEGWPGSENGGITIVSHEIPQLGPLDFDVY